MHEEEGKVVAAYKRGMAPLARVLTDAAIVGLSTIAAYLIAWRYEVGYAKHFRYGAELIEVSFQTALVAWASLIGFAFFGVMMTLALMRFVPFRPTLAFVGAVLPAAMGVLMALLANKVMGGTSPKVAIVMAAIPLLLAWAHLESLVLRYRKRPAGQDLVSFWEDAARARAQEPELVGGNALEALASTPQSAAYLLVFATAAILASLVAFGAEYKGTWDARRRADFIVVDGEPPRVVLRRFGDVLLAGDLMERTKVLRPCFTTMPLGERIRLVSLHLGPLSVRSDHYTRTRCAPADP